jgi:hypothetical protein
MNQGAGMKPKIRLPSDEGPNPYDSATPLQKPLLIRWEYILTVIAFGVVITYVRFPEAFHRLF